MTMRILSPFLALAVLAGCMTQQDQNTVLGAAGGAVVGAAISSDSDRTKGALVGAAVGAIAGNLLGPASTAGQCRYRDSAGNVFIAACP